MFVQFPHKRVIYLVHHIAMLLQIQLKVSILLRNQIHIYSVIWFMMLIHHFSLRFLLSTGTKMLTMLSGLKL
jgi:hypothetical protein